MNAAERVRPAGTPAAPAPDRSCSYTPAEELANALTHGVGMLLGIAGLVLLVVSASLRGGAREVVSCSVYGASLVLLYAASTLYHSVRSPRARRLFKIVDHSSIYLLVAGTYTPFLLVTLRGGWGWSLFGVVWGLAAAGIVFKALFVHRFRLLSTLLYVGMGWVILIAIRPLLRTLPAGGLVWLVAGGLCYTCGVAFYLWKRLPYGHAVWHLFVLAGSLCHFFGVLLYVVPAR